MGLGYDTDRRADAELRRGDPAIPRGPLTLVVDASLVRHACIDAHGFGALAREDLVAPPLMWSEVRSSLHEAVWRKQMSSELARAALERLARSPIGSRSPAALGAEAWAIADELGWAKTYDAEYLALARLVGCRLLTLDARMRRATSRFGFVIGPDEL